MCSEFDARMASVVAAVGLSMEVIDRPTATLSGGRASRVALAAIELANFDVLLLDEPTNDLDALGLAMIDRFVGESTAAIVVVSHDRAFLARHVESVVELGSNNVLAAAQFLREFRIDVRFVLRAPRHEAPCPVQAQLLDILVPFDSIACIPRRDWDMRRHHAIAEAAACLVRAGSHAVVLEEGGVHADAVVGAMTSGVDLRETRPSTAS
jgi:energy-coupling factor transporter ATP-binding protein EcfA2